MSSNFLKFYIKDIRTLPDPKDDMSIIAAFRYERQKKCLSFARADDRRRSLAAGMIEERIKKDFSLSDIRTDVRGKPIADGVCFSLAHSGDYAIAAVADVPVGCDIEVIRKAPKRVAEKFFEKSELQYIENAEDYDMSFWKIWTCKECYLKMTGEGIWHRDIGIRIRNDGKADAVRGFKYLGCTFHSLEYDGYYISVCTGDDDISRSFDSMIEI